MKWPNIIYKRDVSKYIEAEEDSADCISLYKDIDFFKDDINYTSFIKNCEKAVRHSDDYVRFISQIKTLYGLDFCQACSKLTGSDKITIEMHHGPIFTLYDTAEVMLNYFIRKGYKINTLRMADAILQEHFDLHVQIVMLAVTCHEAVHNRDIFLNLKQGFGDVNYFIEKYADDLQPNQKYKIYNYVNLSNQNDSFDKGVLDVEKVTKMIQF